MYKLEFKDRLKHERCKQMIRTETYSLVKLKWNEYEDVKDNNFEPLIDDILEAEESFSILGRAGCGKSFLLKLSIGRISINRFAILEIKPGGNNWHPIELIIFRSNEISSSALNAINQDYNLNHYYIMILKQLVICLYMTIIPNNK